MKRKLPLYLCLLLLTQCSKCKNDPTPADPASQLPPATQTGAGTFSCLVNGKVYAALAAIKCRGDWQGLSTLYISADCNTGTSYNSDFFSTGMLLDGNLRNGQLFTLARFNQQINPAVSQFVADADIKMCSYKGNNIKTGQVELVKFDPVARIASGRFTFTLYEPGSGCDTLRVTNGRFDVKF